MTQETLPVSIAGVKRELRLFEIKPGVRIAILNILGDTELVDAAAKASGRACWIPRRDNRHGRSEGHSACPRGQQCHRAAIRRFAQDV